jgi:hypothetical protein
VSSPNSTTHLYSIYPIPFSCLLTWLANNEISLCEALHHVNLPSDCAGESSNCEAPAPFCGSTHQTHTRSASPRIDAFPPHYESAARGTRTPGRLIILNQNKTTYSPATGATQGPALQGVNFTSLKFFRGDSTKGRNPPRRR